MESMSEAKEMTFKIRSIAGNICAEETRFTGLAVVGHAFRSNLGRRGAGWRHTVRIGTWHLPARWSDGLGLLATTSLVILAAAAQFGPRLAIAQLVPVQDAPPVFTGGAALRLPPVQDARPAKFDPVEVPRKIEALAAPDESVPDAERPANWLKARRLQMCHS
jgi:hypothetical protein